MSSTALTAHASSQARHFASQISSWYLATLGPHAPHASNVESRLRHPLHVVTRRLLHGEVDLDKQADLEAIFNDDEVQIRGPELSRRSNARMEAFLATCSVALRDERETTKKAASLPTGTSPRIYRQIAHGDLMHRLELYCRT